jgi:hypothetical protein
MRRAVANDVVLAAAPFVSEYFTITPAGVRTVYMDAWRSEALTRELIGSESTRLFDFRRFDRAQFEALHAVLEDDLLDSQFISSQQRLLIFPHYVATGCHYRSLRETFNHALGSIPYCVPSSLESALAYTSARCTSSNRRGCLYVREVCVWQVLPMVRRLWRRSGRLSRILLR